MMRIRGANAILLVAITALATTACSEVVSYDKMQEENDKQALIRDYRECVEAHKDDPAACDHITSGLKAANGAGSQTGN
jgi:hypothetical protein